MLTRLLTPFLICALLCSGPAAAAPRQGQTAAGAGGQMSADPGNDGGTPSKNPSAPGPSKSDWGGGSTRATGGASSDESDAGGGPDSGDSTSSDSDTASTGSSGSGSGSGGSDRGRGSGGSGSGSGSNGSRGGSNSSGGFSIPPHRSHRVTCRTAERTCTFTYKEPVAAGLQCRCRGSQAIGRTQ